VIMTKIVFVSDFYADQLTGGAELTTEALIESSPFECIKLHSKDVTIETLQKHHACFWIFGNFSLLNLKLVPSIVANIKYAILEYDYKFCKYRSIEKHLHETGESCDCHESQQGKLVSAFFYGATKIFWMSSKQESAYVDRFPFLELHGRVLGSVFSKKDLRQLEFLRGGDKVRPWLVQDSESWIKGTDESIAWCEKTERDYELFKKLPRSMLLNKFYNSKGFCFLPRGGDTCPRVVIEAKILGCELKINENVQMANEAWFSHGTPDTMITHLKELPNRFWDDVSRCMDITSTIGAYTTTYNCISQGYPFEECIQSLLANFDEVIVVDAGSTDGTWEQLQTIEGIRAYQHIVDFDHPRWAIHSDGDLKTAARKYVTSDWCWQMDVDEVIHSGQREKIQSLLKSIPKAFNVVSLPVVEYWGSTGKVRIDVNPWKWRISRNHEGIIHGIPRELRLKDDDGNLYASAGTDSCDYVYEETFKRLQHASFYDKSAHEIRTRALESNTQFLDIYQTWFDQIVEELPTVYHYSWYDIERKITSYKTHWSSFWKSMYDLDTEDTAENNVCFDKPWSEVTEDDIRVLAQRLEKETGGHIFHSKIDWNNKTPYIELKNPGPLA
jgi:glycosyltransferase involved in cell wall biosynthesis